MSRRAWIWSSVLAVLGMGFLAVLGAPWLADMTLSLGAGWMRHAMKILPNVTVNGSGVGLLAACLALAAWVGHRFCRWLWHGTGHTEAWRPRWTFAGLATLVLLFAAGMAVTGVAHQTGWLMRSSEPMIINTGRASNPRNAATSLRTLTSAQADFRANDRDYNRENDYWRGDIAGLYALTVQNIPLKLIEVSMAAADAAPTTDIAAHAVRGPRSGYWFKALRFRDEKTPDPRRFAACAYPDGPSSGTFVYIVSHDNTIYRKEGTQPPEVYPDDPEKEGWSKLD